jgi:molybdopterin converting factor small subunit
MLYQILITNDNTNTAYHQEIHMELTVHGPLRGITGSKVVSFPDVDHQESVRNVIERFIKQYPRAESQLFDEAGTLRASVRVLVDGERADPETPCRPAADISLIPAAQGG